MLRYKYCAVYFMWNPFYAWQAGHAKNRIYIAVGRFELIIYYRW